MKNFLYIGLFLLTAACFGGKSPSSVFYTLKPLDTAPATFQTPVISLGVEPVNLPGYLDKPQLVLSNENGIELSISETNRWAESLSTILQRTISKDLSIYLPKATVVNKNYSRETFDYSLIVEVLKLDGVMEKNAVLEVMWSLVDVKGTLVVQKRATFTAPIDDTYDDFVFAQSKLVGELSKQIATTIAKEANAAKK